MGCAGWPCDRRVTALVGLAGLPGQMARRAGGGDTARHSEADKNDDSQDYRRPHGDTTHEIEQNAWNIHRASVNLIGGIRNVTLVSIVVRGCNMDSSPSFFRRIAMAALPNNGMVHLGSPYSVTETVKRLEAVLRARDLTVFARVDHSGEAAKVGLKMRATQLIIFGSPKGGTPLMVASPTLAIDLPLKALAWEDAEGKVWLSYNSPDYLKQRHNFPDELVKNIAGAGAALEEAVK
jgi:uncharacterized protein (DUF302 family)